LSAKAESVITHTDVKDVEQAQKEFLAKVAPLHSMEDGGRRTKKGRRLQKISTYQKTARLVQDELSLKEIAKERETTVETIISHIEHLVASDDPEERLDMSDVAYLKYEISPQHFPKIEKALEAVAEKSEDGKPPLLSPVKSLVGPSISFNAIRLARVLLGYMKKANAN
jgi:predicted DNA-binding protein YlxM (UPF0122 family)